MLIPNSDMTRMTIFSQEHGPGNNINLASNQVIRINIKLINTFTGRNFIKCRCHLMRIEMDIRNYRPATTMKTPHRIQEKPQRVGTKIPVEFIITPREDQLVNAAIR